MRAIAIFLSAVALAAASPSPAQTNLVANGSFEVAGINPASPADWSAAGNPALKQALTADTGRDGGRCARLDCTVFSGDGPDFHAMICQVGRVGVRAGQWYRLSFWARAANLKAGAVEVGLSKTRPWDSAGLSEAFPAQPQWQRFEFRFRARIDVPAATSRLQFWFKGTGTLWLDEVELMETANTQEWFPQIATDGVKNWVPNSSFECGAAGWGSLTYGLQGWAGNLYRLEGEIDDSTAWHGRHSLRVDLKPATLPVFWFDYFEPVRQPVRRVLAANLGWLRVTPGEPLTLSAYLRADTENTTAILALNEAPDRAQRRSVPVGREWRRVQFNVKPSQPFVFVAVGLDLEASGRDSGTLWVDAVQFERGTEATDYAPRLPLESFIETGVTGNIFTNVARGASFTLRAFNDTDTNQSIRGRLSLTDFFDRPAFEGHPSLKLPARSGGSVALGGVLKGRRGYFAAAWTREPEDRETNRLRCAIIEPFWSGSTDSPFGFNHAYPWDFLVHLARQAGIVWWRDWSAKWHTVEPERGRFDFAVADAQIHRVLGLNSAVEVLLPFPSSAWSTSARPDEVAKAAGNNAYLKTRLPFAYAPKDLDDFGRYAAQVVRRYHESHPRPVTHFQILNEPVYTDYALPRQFGYGLDDYLKLLETAFHAMKEVDLRCQVVGGISANLDAGLTRDFVTKGGLRFVDVLDLHLYDPARPAESFEESFASLEALMNAHGGPRPVWITEWGCYADDDPPCVPVTVGDATMNRCRWPSERAATEHIVKFTTIGFAHGLRKVFFHAGTAGPINGPDAGGVLFEYGGAPRRMYPGVAAFTRLVGVPETFVRKVERDGLIAYVFRSVGQGVAVAWSNPAEPRSLRLPGDVQAFDIMGDRLTGDVPVTATPLYLAARTPAALTRMLTR